MQTPTRALYRAGRSPRTIFAPPGGLSLLVLPVLSRIATSGLSRPHTFPSPLSTISLSVSATRRRRASAALAEPASAVPRVKPRL